MAPASHPLECRFKQIAASRGIERLKSPVVENEKIGMPQRAQQARMAAVAARQGENLEELGHAVIEHRAIVAAGFVADSTNQPAFADASWAG
jgi:hypothetical protein